MKELQDTLLFPFQDRESSSQFLIACAVMLAAFVIPILPVILLTGYSMKVMRQVIDERKPPTMPAWAGSDWSDMLLDGLRLYGAQLVLMLPLLVLLGCGILSLMGGSVGFSVMVEEGYRSFGPIAGFLLLIGMGTVVIFTLLSIPYGIVTAAAQAHVATRRSFSAAFEFQQWWQVFRNGLSHFVIVYVLLLVASFLFTFMIQAAMVTIVLICIVPFLMIPYSTYLVIVTNTLYAQAYAAGRDGLQTT